VPAGRPSEPAWRSSSVTPPATAHFRSHTLSGQNSWQLRHRDNTFNHVIQRTVSHGHQTGIQCPPAQFTDGWLAGDGIADVGIHLHIFNNSNPTMSATTVTLVAALPFKTAEIRRRPHGEHLRQNGRIGLSGFDAMFTDPL